jgi:hypothetical protein
MTKPAKDERGPRPESDEGLVLGVLEHLAIPLSNQNQFVAHRGSRSISDRAIQLPARAIDLMAAADGLDEA